MKPPTDLNRCLAILILRSIKCTQEDVASILHCAKSLVGEVEKWFVEIPFSDALDYCNDQAIKTALILDIVTSDEQMEKIKIASAALVTGDYIMRSFREDYKSLYKSIKEQPSLEPRSQEHYARLCDAAEKLRQNIKLVKTTQGKFTGNITCGAVTDGENKTLLTNVDRLDAECLLSHLKSMYSEFKDIGQWEELDTRKAMTRISEGMRRKLKLVSHGLAIKGTCRICESWHHLSS